MTPPPESTDLPLAAQSHSDGVGPVQSVFVQVVEQRLGYYYSEPEPGVVSVFEHVVRSGSTEVLSERTHHINVAQMITGKVGF